MKKTAGLIIITALALIMLAHQPATAAAGAKNPNKQIFKELRDQIHDYIKKDVLPDLTAWKAKLDGAMSKEDLATLNGMRAEAKQMHQGVKAGRRELRLDKKANNDQDKEATLGRRDAAKSGMKDLLGQLKPLAAKYEATLGEIAAAAQPKVDVWEKNVQAIADKWESDHKDELAAMKEKSGKGFQKPPIPKDFAFGLDKNKKAVRFMLWDGSEDFLNPPPPPEGAMGNNMNRTPVAMSSGNLSIQVNPNPVAGSAKITFNLAKAGNVSVELFDNFANKIGGLYSGEMSQGAQTLDFNPATSFNGISNGVYIIKVNAGESGGSQKIVIKR